MPRQKGKETKTISFRILPEWEQEIKTVVRAKIFQLRQIAKNEKTDNPHRVSVHG